MSDKQTPLEPEKVMENKTGVDENVDVHAEEKSGQVREADSGREEIEKLEASV